MLNTVGAATAIRAALPGMMAHYKETGTAASVVLFSSVAVQQGFPNHAIIGAVKGAWCCACVSACVSSCLCEGRAGRRGAIPQIRTTPKHRNGTPTLNTPQPPQS